MVEKFLLQEEKRVEKFYPHNPHTKKYIRPLDVAFCS